PLTDDREPLAALSPSSPPTYNRRVLLPSPTALPRHRFPPSTPRQQLCKHGPPAHSGIALFLRHLSISGHTLRRTLSAQRVIPFPRISPFSFLPRSSRPSPARRRAMTIRPASARRRAAPATPGTHQRAPRR